jgi:hypothetical protein
MKLLAYSLYGRKWSTYFSGICISILKTPDSYGVSFIPIIPK